MANFISLVKKVRSDQTGWLVWLSYFFAYSIIFFCTAKGAGGFWDWSVPYFREHLLSLAQNYSWVDTAGLGGPLGYASSYYFGHFFAGLYYTHLAPEIILWLLVSLTASISSFVVFKIVKTKISVLYAVLFGFMVVLNPAYFYKLLAGHLAYLVAFSIFTVFIYFLIYKYRPTIKHTIVLALLFALLATQIQFLIFGAITAFIFLVFYREKFRFRFISLFCAVVVLINLPWLSNYIIGANSVTATSQNATVMQFSLAEFASPQRIFFMIFAPATNIQYAYSRWMLIFFGLFSACLGALLLYYFYLLRTKKLVQKNRPIAFLITNLVVFSFIGTGYFQKIPIPYLDTFYPMLRESGHLAPLIILFEILTFTFLLSAIREHLGQKNPTTKVMKMSFLLYIIIFLLINITIFWRFLPKLNFSIVREQFQQFENFNQTDTGSIRILSYPFWDQYGFNQNPNIEKNGKLLNNSAWEIFLDNSGKEHISNYQPGGVSIDDTLQYRLLKSNDLTELEQKNVGYIYDFSNIYTSNWDLYTPAETYHDNLELIKNNPDFFAKLVEENKGKIAQVSDGIYKLNDTLPRIYITAKQTDETKNKAKLYFKKINPTQYQVTIKGITSESSLNFLDSFSKNWKIYLDPSGSTDLSTCQNQLLENNSTTECLGEVKSSELNNRNIDSAVNQSHTEVFEYANRWILDPEVLKKNNPGDIKLEKDGTITINLTIYFSPQKDFFDAEILSLFTLLACTTFLIYTVFTKNKIKLQNEK